MTSAATPILHGPPTGATGILVLADGSFFYGHGFGKSGSAVGEVCFNTAMTGYQEVLTDPSYAGQIITFTFPHIGNVGTNPEDIESMTPAARGFILREAITEPANFRSNMHLSEWAEKRNLVGLSGVDTRCLTRHIRLNGAPNGIISYSPDGTFDLGKLQAEAKSWPGLLGMDLAKDVTCEKNFEWSDGLWQLGSGFKSLDKPDFHVVAVDYGIKRNILRCLSSIGARVTVVSCTTPAADILALEPDGIFLSNGPGDPAATGKYAIPILQDLIASGKPVFGICLGHQLLALALGASTSKMHQGHRGANHPVKDYETKRLRSPP